MCGEDQRDWHKKLGYSELISHERRSEREGKLHQRSELTTQVPQLSATTYVPVSVYSKDAVGR